MSVSFFFLFFFSSGIQIAAKWSKVGSSKLLCIVAFHALAEVIFILLRLQPVGNLRSQRCLCSNVEFQTVSPYLPLSFLSAQYTQIFLVSCSFVLLLVATPTVIFKSYINVSLTITKCKKYRLKRLLGSICSSKRGW